MVELAAIEFAGAKRLAGMPKQLRETNVHAIAKNVYTAALIAAELTAMDKADVVQKVSAEPDLFGPATLMALADARENARALLEVISCGEARLAVALAAAA